VPISRSDRSDISLASLRDELKGRIIGPDDGDYDEARTVFYGDIDRRPAVIIRVADAGDVARTVSLARESGVELAVRSGAHSVAGYSVVDDGIVLDLGDMKGIDIDVQNRTAWAETGLTAGEYTTAAAAHGLATGFGDTGSVGIGGLTLGGGIGYLVRKYGMTIDDLLAADIVTADGQLLQVDGESHPDLFWAIRGGGGNFGVTTRLKFRLHEVNTIVGGMLFLPASPGVIASLVEETALASEDLSAIVNVMTAPPMPFIPEEHHGKPVMMLLLAHSGPIEEGEQFVHRLRKLGPPIADMVRPMPYPEIYPPEMEDYHPVAASRTMFADTFDRNVALSILEHLEGSAALMAATQLRALGGAMARVPVDATAFAYRSRPIMANVAAIYDDPDQREQHEAWVADLSSVVAGDSGAYVGFLGHDGPARIREAYPGHTWDRLLDVKRRYDPSNLFRLNLNISPNGD
jgi:FAD/FMN-containing dehydrogenase